MMIPLRSKGGTDSVSQSVLGNSDWLDFFAAGTHIAQHCIDADLVDHAQAGVGQAQRNPTVFGFDENAAILQIRQKATLGFVVCMGNVIADHRPFPSDLADTRHIFAPKRFPIAEKTRVYPEISVYSMTWEKQLCLLRGSNLTFKPLSHFPRFAGKRHTDGGIF
jgi:hypothetical protein